MDKKVWQWQRTINSQTFLLSSNRTLLPHAFVQESFATEDMYWARPMSSDQLRTMLSNSLTTGVYLISPDNTTTPVGMARIITDYITFAYLTDVYLQPSYRALGLGTWLIQCCREIVLEMPALRSLVLLTGSEQAAKLYRKELGMQLLEEEDTALTCMRARRATLADAASAAGPIPQDEPEATDA
ncbi:acetyltransferase [Cucurbitaria berberidis CBS 394.84]|uniref:Acetyltransferase n=1 Tax=Cucurbitaria berberidis CBS 394.84 TaxID=1168544 RepID=A0A9P4GRA8_9PLEO|nr:acetyltransferase [Cucurbitaria berberidis CBS 394.84]KAF1850367.1 acetyltransferase [Cucurbitaria berberidis CBS 394.84]